MSYIDMNQPWSYMYKVLSVPSKSLFPQSCVSFGGSTVGLMVTSSKRAYATPRTAAPRAPTPMAGHCWSVIHRRHSNTQRKVWLSLWGLLMCTRLCLSPPSVSGRYGVWFCQGSVSFPWFCLATAKIWSNRHISVIAWYYTSVLCPAKENTSSRHEGGVTQKKWREEEEKEREREAQFLALLFKYFFSFPWACTI